jgi:phosphatidate cytidylyltransferase
LDPAPPPAKWQDLGVRTLSALLLIPAVIADVWAGGAWFAAAAALIGVLMAREWTDLVHGGDPVQFAIHAAAALIGVVAPGGPLIALALLLILTLVSAALKSGGGAWRHAGVFYVGLPVMALVLLRADALHGIAAILFVLIAVWVADTAAFFAGRLIGGPKLAPAISPKKTWAGLGGAVAGGALAAALFATANGYDGLAALALIGAVLGLIEQGGDLFESAVKRHYGVKDSGRLIPGHGGMLDRVDGLVAAAVFAAAIGVARGGTNGAGAGLLAW